jgi:hypothetical protein
MLRPSFVPPHPIRVLRDYTRMRVAWAKLCPRTIQSGAKHKTGKTPKGNPYLKGVLGQAAGAAARTSTFLGERYRRIVKRRGKGKALVAVTRSILVIIWRLLADPATTYHDLGADYHITRLDKDRKIRNHIRQIEALGYQVTLTPQPDPVRPSHKQPGCAGCYRLPTYCAFSGQRR